MEFDKKLELVLSLRDASMTKWSFLLTVSIGIIAYIATLNGKGMDIYMGSGILISFILFFISNIYALNINFQTRSKLHSLAKKDKCYDEYEDLFNLNVPATLARNISLIFHLAIDLMVVVMVCSKIKWG